MAPQTVIPLNRSRAVCINTDAGFQHLSDEAATRFSHARSITLFMSQIKELQGIEERDVAAIGSVLDRLIAEGIDLQEAARLCVREEGVRHG